MQQPLYVQQPLLQEESWVPTEHAYNCRPPRLGGHGRFHCSIYVYGAWCFLQEVDAWSRELQTFPLKSLLEPFKLIAEWHEEGDHTYTYNAEGMQVYRNFANEMAELMNEQWTTGALNLGNVSKDKRTMIRYLRTTKMYYNSMEITIAQLHAG